MANDRETKSYEVKPERPQDTSAAIRAGGGDTMAGGKDADLRPHRAAGSSGTGLPPHTDTDMRIHRRGAARPPGKAGGDRTATSSRGTQPGQDRGADDDR